MSGGCKHYGGLRYALGGNFKSNGGRKTDVVYISHEMRGEKRRKGHTEKDVTRRKKRDQRQYEHKRK